MRSALCAQRGICSVPWRAGSASYDGWVGEPAATSGGCTFHNSMPIGNGNVAANVNYESANDTIAVLLATTAFCFAELACVGHRG